MQPRANEAIDSDMTDESAEIFDDLYLGLRAGGALRKQRRGEALTTEEQEALGRWQRLRCGVLGRPDSATIGPPCVLASHSPIAPGSTNVIM